MSRKRRNSVEPLQWQRGCYERLDGGHTDAYVTQDPVAYYLWFYEGNTSPHKVACLGTNRSIQGHKQVERVG